MQHYRLFMYPHIRAKQLGTLSTQSTAGSHIVSTLVCPAQVVMRAATVDNRQTLNYFGLFAHSAHHEVGRNMYVHRCFYMSSLDLGHLSIGSKDGGLGMGW